MASPPATNSGWFDTGKIGKALMFDGENDYVNGGTNTSLNMGSGNLTIAGWFKTRGNAANTIAGKGAGNPGGGKRYALFASNNNSCAAGKVVMEIDDDTTKKVVCSSRSYNDDTWHHAVGERDGNNLRLFVDGLEETPTDITGYGNIDSSQIFSIGSHFEEATGNPVAFLNGKVDDVRVYNYALSADQIKILYNNSSNAFMGQDTSDPLNTGLVGYWKMDDGVGNPCPAGVDKACDSSGNNNTGTWTNGTASTSGKFGYAANFDGVNDYIDLDNPSSLQITGALSISGWINMTDISQNAIVSKHNSFGNFGYSIETNNGGNLEMYVSSDGTALTSVTGPTALSANTWYHYVGVFVPGTSLTMYINGAQVAQNTSSIPSAIHNTSAEIRIGTDPGGPGWEMAGKIDDVRIYNRALSSSEASSLYDWGPGPVGWWKLDERTGTTANDISGNANTGTLTNGPQWSTGKVGQALQLDGVDDYVDAGSGNVLDDLGPLTFSAWIFPKSTGGSDDGRIIAKGNLADSGNLLLSIDNTAPEVNAFTFRKNGSTPLKRSTADNTVSFNTWQHIEAIWDGTTSSANVHIYKNGVELPYNVSTDGVTLQSDNTLSFIMGNQPDLTRTFDGKIDDVRIYNYARTPAQIAWDYNRGGLIALWKFDECSGATATDLSGNGNNGTINIGGSGSQTTPGNCVTTDSAAAWYNGRNGKYNSSLNFDGTDDRVSMGTPANLNITGPLTLSAWVSPDTANQTTFLVSKHNSNFRGSYELRMDGGGVTMKVYGNCSSGTSVGFFPLPLNTWTHVVGVYNPSTAMQLYINGTLQEQNTSSIPASNCSESHTFQLAHDPESSTYFDGSLDDVRVYNYPLTQAQIKTLFNENAAVRFGPLTGSP